jgi:hypothetical protein
VSKYENWWFIYVSGLASSIRVPLFRTEWLQTGVIFVYLWRICVSMVALFDGQILLGLSHVISTTGPTSSSSGQSFRLLIMRPRVRFPVLPWGFVLEGKDSHGDYGLGSLVELRLRPLLVLHIHISPSTSSGQHSCASWASQPQQSVTLRPQPSQ